MWQKKQNLKFAHFCAQKKGIGPWFFNHQTFLTLSFFCCFHALGANILALFNTINNNVYLLNVCIPLLVCLYVWVANLMSAHLALATNTAYSWHNFFLLLNLKLIYFIKCLTKNQAYFCFCKKMFKKTNHIKTNNVQINFFL